MRSQMSDEDHFLTCSFGFGKEAEMRHSIVVRKVCKGSGYDVFGIKGKRGYQL